MYTITTQEGFEFKTKRDWLGYVFELKKQNIRPATQPDSFRIDKSSSKLSTYPTVRIPCLALVALPYLHNQNGPADVVHSFFYTYSKQ